MALESEAPIYVSRVTLVFPKTNLPTRVDSAYLEDGTRVRASKSSGKFVSRPEILKQMRKEQPPDDEKGMLPTMALHRSFEDDDGLCEQSAGFKALLKKGPWNNYLLPGVTYMSE